MVYRLAVWCLGLLFVPAVPLAPGPASAEMAKDLSVMSSTPVCVGGVDFEISAEATWERPAEIYGTFDPGIHLRITNRTDRDLTFDMGGTLRVSLKLAEGSELVEGFIPERHFPKPVNVAAGNSENITLPIRLRHTRIRHVCLGAESSEVAGTNWLTGDLRPGQYRLSLSLENSRKGHDAWIDKM